MKSPRFSVVTICNDKTGDNEEDIDTGIPISREMRQHNGSPSVGGNVATYVKQHHAKRRNGAQYL